MTRIVGTAVAIALLVVFVVAMLHAAAKSSIESRPFHYDNEIECMSKRVLEHDAMYNRLKYRIDILENEMMAIRYATGMTNTVPPRMVFHATSL